MSLFMLETDNLSSVSSQLKGLTSHIEKVRAEIDAYDTSCEDGFDFISVKNSIIHNIDSLNKKIVNSSKLMDSVINSHTTFQNSFINEIVSPDSVKTDTSSITGTQTSAVASTSTVQTSGISSSTTTQSGDTSSTTFNQTDDTVSTSTTESVDTSSTTMTHTDDTSSTISTQDDDTTITAGSYVDTAHSYSGSDDFIDSSAETTVEDGTMASATALTTGTTVAATTISSGDSSSDITTSQSVGDDNDLEINNAESKAEVYTVQTHLDEVGYAYVDSDLLTEESIKLFEKSEFHYDDEGYARIGERYVVACDESVGKVGDVIRFVKDDNETVELIIGTNTYSDKYNNVVNFLIDENQIDSFGVNEVSKSLVNNYKTVENCGNYEVYDTKNNNVKVDTIDSVSIENNEVKEGDLNG